jgi:ribosome-binding factor A
MSVRSERVGSLIKEELSSFFQRNFSMSDYGFITVTEVEMSPDLKIAKVYISVFGDKNRKKKSIEMLEGQKSSIRFMLGRNVRLRFTPEIIFYLDETLDKAMKLEKIFKKIHEQELNDKDESVGINKE